MGTLKDLSVRSIAGDWLEPVKLNGPENVPTYAKEGEDRIIEWGANGVAWNMYPNFYEILIEHSSTTTTLVNKIVDFITGNIPKPIRHIFTTSEKDHANTVRNQVRLLALDMVMFRESCALWVGYNPKTYKINQFKRLPLSWCRYYNLNEREKAEYQTEKKLIVRSLDGVFRTSPSEGQDMFFQYDPNPERVKFEMGLIESGCGVSHGQVIFLNTADKTSYPLCTYDGMIAQILSDVGLATAKYSYLVNGRIAQTYISNNDTTALERMVQDVAYQTGMMDKWDAQTSSNFVNYASAIANTDPRFGTGQEGSGVKGVGAVTAIRGGLDSKLTDQIFQTDVQAIMDELTKMKEDISRDLAIRAQVPFEYIFGMKSGAVSQTNIDAMISEMDITFDSYRDTIENLFNTHVLNPEISEFSFKMELRAFGEGKKLDTDRGLVGAMSNFFSAKK